jgi:hypothetical protein
MTPFQKLKSLENPDQYLKQDVSILLLNHFEKQMSDTDAAHEMQKQKHILRKSFHIS